MRFFCASIRACARVDVRSRASKTPRNVDFARARLEMIRSGDIQSFTIPTLGDVSRATSPSIR